MKDTKNIKKFLKTVFARKVTVINAIIVLIFIFLAISFYFRCHHLSVLDYHGYYCPFCGTL